MIKYAYILLIAIFLFSCNGEVKPQDTKAELVRAYIDALNTADYTRITSYFNDSIRLNELDYKSAFSKKQYHALFQWDSVFNPKYEIVTLNTLNDSVFLRVAKTGKRIQFLNEAPIITNEVVTFKNNKIHTIAIKSYGSFNDKAWDANRTKLVDWIRYNHPALDGFLYDQTIEGALKFTSALTAYKKEQSYTKGPSLIVLGTVQDAGSPHIACTRDCCKDLFERQDPSRKVVSLGVIDPESGKKFLFEATPNITTQLKALQNFGIKSSSELPDGIFLTHAHIGHYTGLMYLGKEATNASGTMVYAMPKMKRFLTQNGPWSQLVSEGNITIHEMQHQKLVPLTANLSVIPFIVPHRDEFSETIGYTIIGPRKKVLFIPDIDKWEQWNKNIVTVLASVDVAYIDATFYDGEEIGYRDISQIPHPFVIESMALFENLPLEEKNKIHFIHFNHTNPLLEHSNKAIQNVINNGFHISQLYDAIEL